jgi:hypothetical protein
MYIVLLHNVIYGIFPKKIIFAWELLKSVKGKIQIEYFKFLHRKDETV